MPYLMKEYASGASNPQEQYFGYKLCSARNVIECAFGRLKARFAALKRAMDINVDDLPYVIYACFVIHNLCELSNESVCDGKVRRAVDYDREFQPPALPDRYTTDCNETEGKIIRRILTRQCMCTVCLVCDNTSDAAIVLIPLIMHPCTDAGGVELIT